MIIGTVKEIKDKENRVGLSPKSVFELTNRGHQVLVEKNAGLGSDFSDDEYKKAGAKILPNANDVWNKSDLVVKIKEPLKEEFKFLRKNLILFTYLHLAAVEDLTRELVNKKVTAIAYETVEDKRGQLPLLKPMSEVAGRMSVQAGIHYLEKTYGGRGILIGGVTGVNPGKVTIIGAGVVGINALQMAYGLQAKVVLFDLSQQKLENIRKKYPKIEVAISNEINLIKHLKDTDLLIGAVLIPGAKAPRILTKKMISLMPKGSVFVDVSIDQGGISETSRVTSHSIPTRDICGVIHYCVPNIPGAVPRTSTIAITNATLPYIIKLAKLGFNKTMENDKLFAKGVNCFQGQITNKPVAEAYNLQYRFLLELIE